MKLPVSPRTIVYTSASSAGEFHSRYNKSFYVTPNQRKQADHGQRLNVYPLFGPGSPRILTMMDGPGALVAERIWDHVFFESLPTTPFNATKSIALFGLLASLALERCGTIVAGINTRNDEDALIFERSLYGAGVLGQDIVSFWLNSETNAAVRYLRIPANTLVHQHVHTQVFPQGAFASLFNYKTLATERGAHI
jgi:hypothetical protein